MHVSNEQITEPTADGIANFIEKRKLNGITKLVFIEIFFLLFSIITSFFFNEMGLFFFILIL